MLDHNGIACVGIGALAALIAGLVGYAALVVITVFIAALIAAHLIMPYGRH